MEANGLMAGIVTDPILSVFINVVIIGVVLLIVYKRMVNATDKQLRIAKYIFNVAIGVYMLINISHLTWLVMYLTR